MSAFSGGNGLFVDEELFRRERIVRAGMTFLGEKGLFVQEGIAVNQCSENSIVYQCSENSIVYQCSISV